MKRNWTERIRLMSLLSLTLFLAAGIFAGCTAQKAETIPNAREQARKANAAPRRTPITEPANEDISEPTKEDTTKAGGEKIVNKANFDKIKPGMTYEQVSKMLGDKGLKVSVRKVNGRETTTYKWATDNFSSYIDVEFENDLVVEKNHKGLN